MDTPQPSDPHQHVTSPPITAQQEPPQQSVPLPTPVVIRAQAAVDLLHLPTIDPFQNHCCKMPFLGQLLIHRSFSGPPELSQNNYSAECQKTPKQKHYTTPHQTHDPKTQETK